MSGMLRCNGFCYAYGGIIMTNERRVVNNFDLSHIPFKTADQPGPILFLKFQEEFCPPPYNGRNKAYHSHCPVNKENPSKFFFGFFHIAKCSTFIAGS